MKTLAQAGDKAEILRRLGHVRFDSPPQWGRMSAPQMICHLTDSFRVVIGQKRVSHASGPLQRTVVKWLALYAPLRWPAGVPTRPEVDQELEGTPPADFAADVAALVDLVELITTNTRAVSWEPHPIFGKMSERAWLRWAYLHVDHHLRQFGA
jgi:hypothetical protein